MSKDVRTVDLLHRVLVQLSAQGRYHDRVYVRATVFLCHLWKTRIESYQFE